ncbi:unnamed protein product [Macrosiphum euphorbiae]|uniref:Uncharacterized protein n=1 Tax=Macrosiphum euphorbiae TaxID=13131 RepID=A0AAV0WL60_9HEMI|nr:unnamed protein product [Macrosiphum euphorbiae]
MNAISVISKWYNEAVVPRNKVQGLINDINVFNSNCMEVLKNKVLNTLEGNKSDLISIPEISDMFNVMNKPFINLESEYK